MSTDKDWERITEEGLENPETNVQDVEPSNAPTLEENTPQTLPDSAKEVEDWQAEVKQLSTENVRLQEEVENNHNKWLREVANTRTVQNRSNKALEEAQKFAIESFAKDLLHVLDSLDKALEHPSEAQAAPMLEGVELTAKMFSDTLTKHGVEALDPQGEAFDPHYHEALSMQVTEDAAPNTILATIQKGYVLNGRLMRPARVIVAKAN